MIKYIIKFLFVIISSLIITSCDSKLELFPKDALDPDKITESDGEKLLNGIYDAFQKGNTGSGFAYLSYVTEDLSGDNLKYRATFFQHGEIDNNNILTNNVLTERYFNFPYVAIQRANDLIEIVNKSTSISAPIKNKLLGSAYFLRAYGYYRLVTIFGPVPIVSTRILDPHPRNSVDEVYEQIINDLLSSIENPATFTNSNLISVEAAKALLARVYLLRKDKENAKKLALEVINSGKFQIEPDYSKMFNAPFESKEHIFKMNNTKTEEDNSLGFFLQHSTMPGSGRAELPVDESLINAYESGDKRKEGSVTEILAPTTNAGWYTHKYQDVEGNNAHPYYILRLSEMHLIVAECDIETNNDYALTHLNIVRKNRGLGDKTTADLYDIIAERRVEFAFENLRWTDMRRTPSLSDPSKSMATVFLESKGRSKNDELYPIPTPAINTNPLLLPNNPGY